MTKIYHGRVNSQRDQYVLLFGKYSYLLDLKDGSPVPAFATSFPFQVRDDVATGRIPVISNV